MPRPIDVLIEQGKRKTFASALDWPGWARSDRDPAGALAALDEYRDRYSRVLDAAGLPVPSGRLVVTETVPGDATTDFGAPSVIADADRRALRANDRARLCSLLVASWDAFDDVTSKRVVLRSGPRGGGRSLEQLRRHVTDGEVSYARGLGLRPMAMCQRSLHCATTCASRCVENSCRFAIRSGRLALPFVGLHGTCSTISSRQRTAHRPDGVSTFEKCVASDGDHMCRCSRCGTAL